MPDHKNRDHAFASASSSGTWIPCPPSAAASAAYPDEGSTYANEGTRAHEVAESVATYRLHNMGRLPDLGADPAAIETGDTVTEEMVNCAVEYSDYILENLTSEENLVVLEHQVDFSEWVPDGFGTADCIIISDDTLHVIDFKYGQGVYVPAKNNSQLRLYALGAFSDFGFAYDIKKVVMHIFQPRLGNISTDEISVEDLLEWGEKVVRPAAEKAVKGKGKHNPGPHCQFCHHAGRCRALTKYCTEFVQHNDLRIGVPVLAPFEIANILQMRSVIELWLRRVGEQAYNMMMNGEEVPGYKLIEGKLGNRKWADENKVIDAMKRAGYDADDIMKSTVKSPAEMDKTLGKKKAGELLSEFVTRAPGKITIAPETDSRPAYTPDDAVKKDFEEET